eukprot:CAMPEP_0176096760 /NCGR_PEP_ID=MMETSP0120_2-20121206/48507_1 /TAXON_ID=160619 /ORGANISM="Kryptoperidinium foliaceum, Strain CCMP 1326" /LENGTH=61 /DNA_ID=CAMNT_0017430747 /DNA_START=9 /DNA_END=191 /DNA_ORIENTATION=+
MDTGNMEDLNAFNEFLQQAGETDPLGDWSSVIINCSRWNGMSSAAAEVTIRNLWPLQMHTP